ncbi:hypothetical protein LguiA_017144 [Lonicera macranthoides]
MLISLMMYGPVLNFSLRSLIGFSNLSQNYIVPTNTPSLHFSKRPHNDDTRPSTVSHLAMLTHFSELLAIFGPPGAGIFPSSIRSWIRCRRAKHLSVSWPTAWWYKQFSFILQEEGTGFGGGRGLSGVTRPAFRSNSRLLVRVVGRLLNFLFLLG